MANEGTPLQPQRAVRFIFEYEGDELRLVAQQAVEMVIPPAAGASTADAPGYYLDARDPGERTLARATARGAFARSTEVFPERHDEPITRVDVAQPRGAFTVTLPEIEDADHVTVVRVVEGSVPGALRDSAQQNAVDLASFPLRRR